MKDKYYGRIDLFWSALSSKRFIVVVLKIYFSKWNPFIALAIEIDREEKRIEIIIMGFMIGFLFSGGLVHSTCINSLCSISARLKTEFVFEYFSFKNRQKWLKANP